MRTGSSGMELTMVDQVALSLAESCKGWAISTNGVLLPESGGTGDPRLPRVPGI
jgi:hypothetical protein